MENKLISPWSEHNFWLEILEDHAYFVRDHLSPIEYQYVQTANNFIQAFNNYRLALKQIPPTSSVSSNQLVTFSKEVQPIVVDYFKFESNMQSLRVMNQINLNLTPTFFSGTLSENLEYIRILSYFTVGKDFPLVPISDFLDLWLQDQIGHALLLFNILDPVEFKIRTMTQNFIQTFQGYMIQSRQLRILFNYSPNGEARRNRLALDIFDDTMNFFRLVEEVIQLYKTGAVLTRTTLRFIEHHIPETCYFLKKLSQYVVELQPKVTQCLLSKPSFK